MRKLLFILLLCPSFAYAQGWLWAQASAGTESQGATSIATDRFGNIYMAGYTGKNSAADPENDISFGSQSIVSTDFYYNYIVKYNSSGTALWLNKIPFSDGNVYVATDSAGDVFLAGAYTGIFTIGPYTVTSFDTSSDNLYLARFDSSGTIRWLTSSTSFSGIAGATPSVLTVDGAGNAIVGGVISDTVTFGSYMLTAHNLFITKFDTIGNVKWATSIGGHPQPDSIDMGVLFPDFITGLAIDRQGNIAVTGRYAADTFVAGTYQLPNLSAGGVNSFLIKCDTAGNILWANAIGGATSVTGPVSDEANATAIDSAGNIYIAGVTNADTLHIGGNTYPNTCACYQSLFAKYTANGAFEWFKPSSFPGGSPATNGAAGQSLAALNCSSVYMLGWATDSVSFGSYSLPSSYYIVDFDTSGTALSAAVAGSLGFFQPLAIAVDTGNNAYVDGNYASNCSIGDNTLTLTGTANVFLAKYGPGAVSAVSQVTAPLDWSIFPNPATAELHITSQSIIASITIYNIYGQTIYSNTPAALDIKIDVSSFAPGVYFVKINGSAVKEFVKQ